MYLLCIHMYDMFNPNPLVTMLFDSYIWLYNKIIFYISTHLESGNILKREISDDDV